ncbi:disulfide oxidoreductase [Candidatus Woesearchaeota archaeon]|nr:MAG: disulfide oxidoreductase [Candidatus Woesearchaeota archaeon]
MEADKNKLIKKGMTFSEVLERCPEAAEVLIKHGLHCIGCHVAAVETIEQGCMAHGMTPKQIDEIVEEINSVVNKNKKKEE